MSDSSVPWIHSRAVKIGGILVAGCLLLWLLLRPDSPAVRLLRQDPTWYTIQQQGSWRVGLDPSFPPFESLDDSGTPVGYDVDLARAIGAAWGVDVEIVAVGYDGLVDALMAGRIDSVVSALPYDSRLTKDIAYSEPYFDAGLRLAVRLDSPLADLMTTDLGQENNPPGDFQQLAGRTIAVEWGSNGDMVARRLRRGGIAIDLVAFDTPDDAVAALVQGRADALLVDYVTLRAAQGDGAAVTAVGPALESIPYVIAMPPDAHQLQRAVDTALTNLQNDGMMSMLENRWFGPPPAVDSQ